jgi:hypothetical protein
MMIDGKDRNFSSRRRCFSCSPFGMHHTSKIVYNSGDHTCSQCGRVYVYDKKKGHSHSVCNTCHANIRRLRLKRKMVEHMGGCCAVCGYKKSIAALQFHHRNPSEKEIKLADAYRRKWDVIVAELEKCELLCANCHAERHDLSSGLGAGISTPVAESDSPKGRRS